MENYKGYLIEEFCIQKNVQTFNGQTVVHAPSAKTRLIEPQMAAAGGFTSEWKTRVIEPSSGKTFEVRDTKEAKRIIDDWYTPDGKKKFEELEAEIGRYQESIDRLQQDLNSFVNEQNTIIANQSAFLNNLIGKLPPRFT